MNPFTYSYPVKVYFGEKAAANNLALELAKVGPNVLLAYGGGSIKKTGLYDKIMAVLRERGKEVVELPGHPFFIGVQFHPEYKSTPENPHPLFKGLVKAALDNKK